MSRFLLASALALIVAAILIGALSPGGVISLAGLKIEQGRLVIYFTLLSLGLTLIKLKWGIYSLIALIPFFGNTPGEPLLYLFDILLFILFIRWLFSINRPGNEKLRLTEAGGIILLFAALSAITVIPHIPHLYETISNHTPVQSVRAVFNVKENYELYTLRALINLLEGVGLFFLIVNTLKGERDLKGMILVFLCSFGAVNLFSLLDYLHAIPIDLHIPRERMEGITRMGGLFWNPGWYGEYLAAGALLALGLMLYTQGRRRWVLGLILLNALACLLLTYSRGSWISFSVVALWAILGAKKSATNVRARNRSWFAGALAAALVAVLLGVAVNNNIPLPKLADRFTSIMREGVRPNLARSSLLLAEEDPILGSGIGSFSVAYRKAIPPESPFYQLAHGTAHNTYLNILVERGIVGLALFIALIAALLYRSKRNMLQPVGDGEDGMALGVTLALGGLLVYGLFQYIFFIHAIESLFWTLAATVYVRHLDDEPGPVREVTARYKGIIVALLGLAALVEVPGALNYERGGWFGWETPPGNLAPYRWNKGSSEERLPVNGSILVIPLFASNPDLRERPLRVDILVNGEERERIEIKRDGWEEYAVPLPEALEGENEVAVAIKAGRLWNPLAYGVSKDGRNLGVAVGEMFIKGSPEDTGFYRWERWNGDFYFRWTGPLATEVIRRRGKVLSIPMMAGNPDVGERPVTVELILDGEPAETVRLGDKYWHRITLQADRAEGDHVKISFRPDRTWQPSAMGVSADTRILGIAVGEAEWLE